MTPTQEKVQFMKFLVRSANKYVGETGRSFNTRCREHKRDILNELLGNFTSQNQYKNETARVKHV